MFPLFNHKPATRFRTWRPARDLSTRRRMLPIDVSDCVLEMRLAPVISNLGVIVLTTAGYVLVVPFPGASASPASMGGGFGASAGGASGMPINTAFYILGSGGISSLQPGNTIGVTSPGASAPTGSTGSPGLTINVGSGANNAAALSIPLVTRNTIANDLPNRPPSIGGPPHGYRSAVIATERGQGTTPALPTPPPPPPTGPVPSTSPPQGGTGSHPTTIES